MIEAEFPDGTVQEVPSCTVEIKSKEIGGTGQSTFYEKPIDDDQWRFVGAIGGKWLARPRRG